MKSKVTHLIPIRDQVLLRVEQENVSKTGLFMPIETKESRTATVGHVLAVGDGKVDSGETVHIDFQVHEKVIFNSWSITEVNSLLEDDGHRYVLLPAKDILAKIKGSNE